MAVSPNIFMLDIQTSGKPDAVSRNGRQKEAAGIDFSELLSQRMQTPAAGAKRPSPVQLQRDDTRQIRDTRERSMDRSRDTRPSAEEARRKPAEAKRREDDSHAEAQVADGNNLPPEAQVLPPGGQAAAASALSEGGEEVAVSWLEEAGLSKGGLSNQAALVAEESMDGLDLEGMELDSLALDGEALLKPENAGKLLELSGGKADLAEFKMQLQSLTASSPLSSATVREAQAPTTPYTTSVQVPFNDPKWGEQMINKVLWLTSQNLKSAEIFLNPEDLGPVELKIQVNQDQASIQIQTQNASVREALELNVHRLREALANSGMGLAQFDVSAQSGQQQEQQTASARHQGEGDGLLTGGTDEEQAASQVLETSLPGLINTYV